MPASSSYLFGSVCPSARARRREILPRAAAWADDLRDQTATARERRVAEQAKDSDLQGSKRIPGDGSDMSHRQPSTG